MLSSSCRACCILRDTGGLSAREAGECNRGFEGDIEPTPDAFAVKRLFVGLCCVLLCCAVLVFLFVKQPVCSTC